MPNNSDDLTKLKLIDFGIASTYSKNKLLKAPQRDEDHVDQRLKPFQGNFAFCSPNALLNNNTSRRDDLYSLLYILIYMMTN